MTIKKLFSYLSNRAGSFKYAFLFFLFILLFHVIISIELNAVNEGPLNNKTGKPGAEEAEKKQDKKKGNILMKIPEDIYRILKDKPEELLKYLKIRKWYKKDGKEHKKEIIINQEEGDVTGIKESAKEEIDTFIVLLGEIPGDNRGSIFAPIFITEQKNIFNTITDFSFKWVGYKTTFSFKQKKFPWKKTTLSETLIGSFLYASGTNIGFNRGELEEENRFYTNYTSEIITLKRELSAYTSVGFTLDSRQYFFVERDTPELFIMPESHYNIFPKLDLSLNYLNEKGIDQLASGIKISAWAGYGIRNRWEEWGESGNLETGEEAKTFAIYSIKCIAGLLINNNHNFVIKARYKGGVDNDFLTRPRFGGTIDNARLDVVHGFTLDQFRVKRFSLINARYGYNLFERVRVNLYFDYARVFSPQKEDIFGSGWGLRILAWGGLPIWMTHGIGMKYYPKKEPVNHVFMVMTAAGW